MSCANGRISVNTWIQVHNVNPKEEKKCDVNYTIQSRNMKPYIKYILMYNGKMFPDAIQRNTKRCINDNDDMRQKKKTKMYISYCQFF